MKDNTSSPTKQGKKKNTNIPLATQTQTNDNNNNTKSSITCNGIGGIKQEIYTLRKSYSSSGVSSISFSSEEDQEQYNANRYLNLPANEDLSFVEQDKEVEVVAINGTAREYDLQLDSIKASSLSAKQWGLEEPQTLPPFNLQATPSKTVEGCLVARVLPKQFADYDTQKSMAFVDPDPFIQSLKVWQLKNGIKYTDVPIITRANPRLDQQLPLSFNEEEAVVGLDMYLVRSAFLDNPNQQQTMFGSYINNDELSREQLRQLLINHIDLTRNNSSLSGFDKKESLSTTNCSTAFFSTKTTATVIDYSYWLDNVFHLHMNRSSKEMASRTLRRLELSATRKLQSLKRHGRQNVAKEENLAVLHKLTSSKLVLVGSNEGVDEMIGGEEEEDLKDGYSSDGGGGNAEVDLVGLTSADVWNACSNEGMNALLMNGLVREATPSKTRWAVSLTLPKLILPWSNEDTGEGNDTDATAWSSPSVPSSPILETIQLDVTSNPPTILTVQTFENFTACLFTEVPIVVSTTIMYASHAIVTWFVDEELVVYDSDSYTPSVNDIGKRISILITPIRSGHNGDGCQEAYSFCSLVEALPTMPIVELRRNWIQGKDAMIVSDDEQKHLRVVTVSVTVVRPDVAYRLVLNACVHFHSSTMY